MLPLLLAAALASPQAARAAADCYVDVDAAGNNDGSSWTHAYVDLQDALGNAACSEIWVADGLYVPGASETDTFLIASGVKVYGGFAGTELNISERDPKANLTILSGDIAGDDLNGDNNNIAESYTDIVTENSNHVVTFNGTVTDVTSTTVLDGFTITAGEANGSGADDTGGGLYCNGSGAGSTCSPLLMQLTFSGNDATLYGGGVSNYGLQGDSSPSFLDVTFSGNHAGVRGGGMYNYGEGGLSNPWIERATFFDNESGTFGGAIHNRGVGGISNPTLINVTFVQNRAGVNGGALNNQGNSGISSPTLINVTFFENSADSNGGAIANAGADGGTSAPALTNVILWGNDALGAGDQLYNVSASPIINYSIVQGGDGGIAGDSGLTAWSTGTGNLNADPGLMELEDNGGFTQTMALGARSPATNTGDNGVCPDVDQRGRDRPQGYTCDMGAFEWYPCFVDDTAGGANDGTSWTDAYTDLQGALLNHACTGVWVAAGLYKPGSSESDSFAVGSGVQMYGGFAGTEELQGERVPDVHVSVLSGDIDGNDSVVGNGVVIDHMDIVGDNSDNVVTMDGTSTPVTSTTVLDGFTITGGQADGLVASASSGGGLYCDGGLGGQCSPTLRNISFSGNHAEVNGGAMVNDGGNGGVSSPSLIGVTFSGNHSASGFGGGAMYNVGVTGGVSSPVLTNVTFHDNSTPEFGGGMLNNGLNGTSSPVLKNVTFRGNSAFSGGAMYNAGSGGVSAPILTNVILWDDTATFGPEMYNTNDAAPSISYSVVEGGNGGIVGGGTPYSSGVGNVDTNPELGALVDNGGWTETTALAAGSSALEIGIGGASCPGTDQRGILRPRGTGCDRGAYERIPPFSDFDPDAASDPVVFEKATGNWFAVGSTLGFLAPALNFGDDTDYIPVPGDYDGDTITDAAVFERATGHWFAVGSTAGFFAPALGFGNDANYIPVPGDYDGDGSTDAAVFEKATGNWFVVGSDIGFFAPALGFGNDASYIPVPGDYDGDGSTDPAVFEKATGNWFVVGSNRGFFSPALGFGSDASYIVQPADYDGDARVDAAVFERATGNWFVVGSAVGFFTPALNFGDDTDYIPVVAR